MPALDPDPRLPAMKKFLFIVLLLVAVAGGVTMFYAGSIARSAIERGGTYALGVPTTVDRVMLSPLSGAFGMDELAIANPEGFEAESFVSLGKGSVKADLGSLTSDVVRVESIEFSDLFVSVERIKGGTNYDAILSNLEKFEQEEEASTGEENADGSSKKFIVDRIVLKNISASLSLVPEIGDLAKVDVVVPEIVLTDVGTSEGGASVGQIAGTMVRALLKSSIEAGGGKAPAELLSDLEGRLDDHVARVQDQAEDVVRGSLENVTESVTDKIGDVLGEDVENALEGRAKGELDKALEKGKGALGGLLGGKKDDKE